MQLFSDLIGKLDSGQNFIATNYDISSFSFFTALLKGHSRQNIVIFTPDRDTSWSIYKGVKGVSQEIDVKFFNIPKFFPFSNTLKNENLISEVINLLYSLLNQSGVVFILPCSLILNKFVTPEIVVKNFLTFKRGESIDREVLSMFLIEYGYQFSYLVSNKGEFSFRGDIFDIFTPIFELPLRITLFDNIIEGINFFNPDNQKRSKEVINEFIIPQNSQFIYNEENIKAILDKLSSSKHERYLKEKLSLKQSDLNISMLVSPYSTIFDYIKLSKSKVLIFNHNNLRKKLKDYYNDLSLHFEEIATDGYDAFSYQDYFIDYEYCYTSLDKCDIFFEELLLSEESVNTIDIGSSNLKNMRKKILAQKEDHFHPLFDDIEKNLKDESRIYFFFNDKVKSDNIKNLLASRKYKFYESEHDLLSTYIDRRDRIAFINGDGINGFKSELLKVVIITEQDIFGKKSQPYKKFEISEHSLQQFSELKEDDFVVHIQHGIGNFKGLKRIDISGSIKEFIILEYLNKDRLYIPIEKINLLQKYVGEEGHLPSPDKLGGERWAKVKESVKKAVESVAKELLELYASRKLIKGISFKGNENLIEEFSLQWDFEETPDQQKAIDDVFSDMDADYPMDRLLCGDVGYGKTEVAIRASLKAVLNGYQVGFLVPTTILALQHYKNLKDRFSGYPFVVDMLSRFQTKREQGLVLENLASGKIDIVVGTHRLLQDDVKFKNLGFLIVDEEHKFGVNHKEKLKLLKKSIDVLSMTATPIPRTLQMSFLGVKDLSVINTPPAERQSIETHIVRFKKSVIRSAILKEKERGGQVYFVHNRVKSIFSMGDFLKNLVPEIKIAVAHGQMNRSELENIYKDFIDAKYDLLLSSSIIESGLDNRNVNTILINRADNFGLSQLYQLRGRVGRSNLKSYAYLIVPSEELIQPLALKRLKILQTHSGLSQGFKLAMSDLEIRGAGNLFGKEQSGNLLSVGFEYYMDMLEKSINRLKGEIVTEDEFEPDIIYDSSVSFPENFISDDKERLYYYKKLAVSDEYSQLEEIRVDIEDKYGRLPEEADNLINIFYFKILSKKLMLQKIEIKDTFLILTIDSKSKIDPKKVLEKVVKGDKRFMFLSQNSLKINLKSDTLQRKYSEADQILKEIL